MVVSLSWQTTIIHSHSFVMELLQWNKVCEIGGEELHRPPVVALRTYGMVEILWWYNYNWPIFKALGRASKLAVKHKTNKTLKWNVVIPVYHVHETSSTIPYVLKRCLLILLGFLSRQSQLPEGPYPQSMMGKLTLKSNIERSLGQYSGCPCPHWYLLANDHTKFFFMISFAGNGAIVAVVIRKGLPQTVTHLLVVNLAVAHLLLSLICSPLDTAYLLTHGTWLTDNHGCRFQRFTSTCFTSAAILTLSTIAVDRLVEWYMCGYIGYTCVWIINY